MTTVIEVSHLRKTYGATVAVEDVSFAVQQGEIFGIVGPNGAGKTTAVESIMGLRKPDSGTVRLGQCIRGCDAPCDRHCQVDRGWIRPCNHFARHFLEQDKRQIAV